VINSRNNEYITVQLRAITVTSQSSWIVGYIKLKGKGSVHIIFPRPLYEVETTRIPPKGMQPMRLAAIDS